MDNARLWAAVRLTRVAEQFPHVEPPPPEAEDELSGLSPADRALALAIYRTTVQRWFTLQCILEKYLSKQLRRLEPAMQAVLMSGAAQLVFFDRLPAYAVVDQAVGLARKLVRPNATGMVNAVLRQVDRLTKDAKQQMARASRPSLGVYSPSAKLIPLPGSKALQLKEPVLPGPDVLDKHLAAATSMPLRLVREWLARFGEADTINLCLHTIEHPPTTIAVEQGFDFDANMSDCRPHHDDGFVVWTGPVESLPAFLDSHSDRRVQDVASSLAAESTRDHRPQAILDYCAGQGTKTRQLALMHPAAQVTATDTHPGRRESLKQATATLPNVRVIDPDQSGDQQYDLVLLDVPCSNTGVLARRPEARYRYSQQAIGELVRLQREIIHAASAWLRPSGLLLYSTCSIEPPENQNQAKRLVKHGAELLHEHQQFPSGGGDSYTDGSYHALMRL